MVKLFLSFCAILFLFQIGVARRGGASAGHFIFQQAGDAEQARDPDEAKQLSERVVQLYKAGKVDEALVLARRVVQLRENALGREHQLVSEALINLAELYLAKRSYKEALPVYERVLKNNERLAGPDDAGNALLLDKTAFLRYMTKDFSGAENDYKRSLSINEKVLGPQSAEAAQSAFRLAEFYRYTNSYQKAEGFYKSSLSILEKSLGPENPKLLNVVESYACFLDRMRRESESKAFWIRAGRIRAQVINESLKAKGAQGVSEETLSTLEPISKPQPIYPEEANRTRLIGVATVHVTIDPTGKVIRACASGADPILLEAAEQAALRARFRPLVLEGVPVETTSIIVYSFNIR